METLNGDFWMIWQRDHASWEEDLIAAVRYYTEKYGRPPQRALMKTGLAAERAKAIAQSAGLEWLEADYVQPYTLWLS